MDSVLPLGQWVCSAPDPYPTLKPCFLMLGLKRPQIVMEICHHSQILLHMEAVCPICAGDELLLDRRAGQRSDPNTGFVTPWPSGAGVWAAPLLRRDWVSLGAAAFSTRQGKGPAGFRSLTQQRLIQRLLRARPGTRSGDAKGIPLTQGAHLLDKPAI